MLQKKKLTFPVVLFIIIVIRLGLVCFRLLLFGIAAHLQRLARPDTGVEGKDLRHEALVELLQELGQIKVSLRELLHKP